MHPPDTIKKQQMLKVSVTAIHHPRRMVTVRGRLQPKGTSFFSFFFVLSKRNTTWSLSHHLLSAFGFFSGLAFRNEQKEQQVLAFSVTAVRHASACVCCRSVGMRNAAPQLHLRESLVPPSFCSTWISSHFWTDHRSSLHELR